MRGFAESTARKPINLSKKLDEEMLKLYKETHTQRIRENPVIKVFQELILRVCIYIWLITITIANMKRNKSKF